METNLSVYIINHNTITGYKTKTASVLLVCKIHHKLFMVMISSLLVHKSHLSGRTVAEFLGSIYFSYTSSLYLLTYAPD